MKYVIKIDLKAKRLEKGFTSQGKFAKHIGINKRYISEAESRKPIGELLARRIAQALGLGTNWEYLVEGE